MSREDRSVLIGVVVVVALVVGVIGGAMFVLPQYNKWRKEVSGEGDLAKARSTKLVQIEEANANLQSEILNAKSEVARARGAAKAIEIEGGKLTPEYIQYLWIRQLDLSKSQTIYVPTEAGLPILEAGKRP